MCELCESMYGFLFDDVVSIIYISYDFMSACVNVTICLFHESKKLFLLFEKLRALILKRVCFFLHSKLLEKPRFVDGDN